MNRRSFFGFLMIPVLHSDFFPKGGLPVPTPAPARVPDEVLTGMIGPFEVGSGYHIIYRADRPCRIIEVTGFKRIDGQFVPTWEDTYGHSMKKGDTLSVDVHPVKLSPASASASVFESFWADSGPMWFRVRVEYEID